MNKSMFILMILLVAYFIGCSQETAWHIDYQVKSTHDKPPEKPVKIAILDSGINLSVSGEQSPSIIGSYNAISKLQQTHDQYNHGTKVANVIVDQKIGINKHAKLLDIQVLNANGQGSWKQICDGIDYAIKQKVDILNMSLGFNYDPPGFKKCIDKAVNQNIIIVASAGDSLNDTANYPANYPNVIAVAAIDQDGKLYRFASEGKIDFIAPGVDISVRDADGNQLEISGSSIATANFSGVLSLYLQKGLSLTDVFQNQHYKWIHTGEKEHKMLYFAE